MRTAITMSVHPKSSLAPRAASYRGLLLAVAVLLALGLSSPARADMALVVASHERASVLTQALEVALRGYGLLVGYRSMGDARSPLERAAVAQRVARNVGARVALWVEPGRPSRLRAVGTGEHEEHIVEAPL